MEDYKECSRCLLSNHDTKTIVFDSAGVCNYCRKYEEEQLKLKDADFRKTYLENKISEIKQYGKGKQYDCLLGISGGVDSSYLVYWAKHNGLRPLLMHMDNGWNSELAVQNIYKLCKAFDYELQTHVIDWEEFRALQIAYLKASVVDIEVLTDHAIQASALSIAKKYDIKYNISGFNLATEGIMPADWVYDKTDFSNINDINNKFGTKKIKTFPHLAFTKRLYYHFIAKLETIQPLNYIAYNKQEAKKLLIEKFDWVDYGGKHFESVFTKFYQAYILPHKFGIDKRKAHLSTLINSNQITKSEALLEMQKELYAKDILESEKSYILKKLKLSEQEFNSIMKLPINKHSIFKSDKSKWEIYFKILRLLKGKK